MINKKRIALVHPRGFNWFPGHRDITDIANRMVPQGLLSIAAYLFPMIPMSRLKRFWIINRRLSDFPPQRLLF
jgi:hypothetical protein